MISTRSGYAKEKSIFKRFQCVGVSVCVSFFSGERKAHAVFQAEKFSLVRFQAYPKKSEHEGRRGKNISHRKRYKMMYLLYLLAFFERKR